METNKGIIILKLEEKLSPITVANFVSLIEGTNNFVSNDFVNRPYYDGLTFHRVIENFMIQGGDPTGTGRGNPGYKFDDEFNSNLKHDKAGILSMANSGPSTNGSQFFITHNETPWLDGKHTVFGKVVKGQSVVDSIKQNDTIKKVEIIRKGDSANKFDAPKIFSNHFAKKDSEKTIIIEKNKKILKDLTKNYNKTKSGLFYKITKESNGKLPKKGQTVSVHYKGMLINGVVFDSSYSRNKPLDFSIGIGQVIKGWDEGISILKKGSSASLIIPPELAYGSNGAGNVIPPNSYLIFEVELIDIK
ncbi:MAG: peptidylprolyl isomerase [Flavobacteriaceae bacterium]|nr:peptidylprolyl isomerase [Flavobacteriaceae bacterium]